MADMEAPVASEMEKLQINEDQQEGSMILKELDAIISNIFVKEGPDADPYFRELVNESDSLYIRDIMKAPRVQAVTNDEAYIRTAISNCKAIVSSGGIVHQVGAKPEQKTLILSDVSQSATSNDLLRLFAEARSKNSSDSSSAYPGVLSLRSDMNDTWFVTFESESDAKAALSAIRGCKIHEKSIRSRLKTESFIKSAIIASHNRQNQMKQNTAAAAADDSSTTATSSAAVTPSKSAATAALTADALATAAAAAANGGDKRRFQRTNASATNSETSGRASPRHFSGSVRSNSTGALSTAASAAIDGSSHAVNHTLVPSAAAAALAGSQVLPLVLQQPQQLQNAQPRYDTPPQQVVVNSAGFVNYSNGQQSMQMTPVAMQQILQQPSQQMMPAVYDPLVMQQQQFIAQQQQQQQQQFFHQQQQLQQQFLWQQQQQQQQFMPSSQPSPQAQYNMMPTANWNTPPQQGMYPSKYSNQQQQPQQQHQNLQQQQQHQQPQSPSQYERRYTRSSYNGRNAAPDMRHRNYFNSDGSMRNRFDSGHNSTGRNSPHNRINERYNNNNNNNNSSNQQNSWNSSYNQYGNSARHHSRSNSDHRAEDSRENRLSGDPVQSTGVMESFAGIATEEEAAAATTEASSAAAAAVSLAGSSITTSPTGSVCPSTAKDGPNTAVFTTESPDLMDSSVLTDNDVVLQISALERGNEDTATTSTAVAKAGAASIGSSTDDAVAEAIEVKANQEVISNSNSINKQFTNDTEGTSQPNLSGNERTHPQHSTVPVPPPIIATDGDRTTRYSNSRSPAQQQQYNSMAKVGTDSSSSIGPRSMNNRSPAMYDRDISRGGKYSRGNNRRNYGENGGDNYGSSPRTQVTPQQQQQQQWQPQSQAQSTMQYASNYQQIPQQQQQPPMQQMQHSTSLHQSQQPRLVLQIPQMQYMPLQLVQQQMAQQPQHMQQMVPQMAHVQQTPHMQQQQMQQPVIQQVQQIPQSPQLQQMQQQVPPMQQNEQPIQLIPPPPPQQQQQQIPQVNQIQQQLSATQQMPQVQNLSQMQLLHQLQQLQQVQYPGEQFVMSINAQGLPVQQQQQQMAAASMIGYPMMAGGMMQQAAAAAVSPQHAGFNMTVNTQPMQYASPVTGSNASQQWSPPPVVQGSFSSSPQYFTSGNTSTSGSGNSRQYDNSRFGPQYDAPNRYNNSGSSSNRDGGNRDRRSPHNSLPKGGNPYIDYAASAGNSSSNHRQQQQQHRGNSNYDDVNRSSVNSQRAPQQQQQHGRQQRVQMQRDVFNSQRAHQRSTGAATSTQYPQSADRYAASSPTAGVGPGVDAGITDGSNARSYAPSTSAATSAATPTSTSTAPVVGAMGASAASQYDYNGQGLHDPSVSDKSVSDGTGVCASIGRNSNAVADSAGMVHRPASAAAVESAVASSSVDRAVEGVNPTSDDCS